jgi:hypothetical protein
LVLGKLKAATVAMTQPKTIAVPPNPAAMVANRREVITPWSPFRGPPAMLHRVMLMFRSKNDCSMTRTTAL